MVEGDFIIPLSGLTEQEQQFSWLADKEFFESFGNAEILDAQVLTKVSVMKSERYILLDCDLIGWVLTPCDRCLSPVKLEVDEIADLALLRAGYEGATFEDREEIEISAEDVEFDLKQIVYDYTLTSLPLKKVHEDGECDPEVISRLQRGEFISQEPNPSAEQNPFAKLQGFFNE